MFVRSKLLAVSFAGICALEMFATVGCVVRPAPVVVRPGPVVVRPAPVVVRPAPRYYRRYPRRAIVY